MKYTKWLLLLLVLVSCARKVNKYFATPADVTVLADAAKTNPCDNRMNYAPSDVYPEQTPMRFIRVRFHVIRHHQNDPNSFDSIQAYAYAVKLLEMCNARLSENVKMALPPGNDTPVLPFRYRYVLTTDPNDPNDSGVHVHYDSEVAYFNYKKASQAHYDSRVYNRYGDMKGDVLNIIMLEHDPDSVASPTYKTKSEGVGFTTWLKLVGCKHFLDTVYNADGSFYTAGYLDRLLNHEVGHTLGLAHTWAGNDGCDDTPNHPNCWDQNSSKCPDGHYSNNMMDYNNISRALSPCQLARIHYNFSTIGTSQRKLLVPTWCYYDPSATINIGLLDDITWNSAKDLNGDVVVAGKLTIQCRVSLPKGARIIVKPKGTLILDGAELTNLCDEDWEGIELWEDKKHNKGKVLLSNQPQLMHMTHALGPLPTSGS